MISVTGQLAIRTIHGRNGAFNVGRLTTSISEFVIKNAELDQYREGKYDGDFVIAWMSYLQDGSGHGVYAQRYNASGVPQGPEFRVNT